MKQSARWMVDEKQEAPRVKEPKRLSILKFFKRYPIFLLAFGPPIFRSLAGTDVTKGEVDIWGFLQVGLVCGIATRAIFHLATRNSVVIPKQIRSILRIAFILFGTFLASTFYSTSHPATAAYSMMYLLTWVSIVDFIVESYIDPPNWIQCLFQLRLVALTLLATALITLPINPELVLQVLEGHGIRFLGGSVAPVMVICPVIGIISAYSFLHSLESRTRAFTLFVIGLIGTLVTQVRGTEIALMASLVVLVWSWVRARRRAALYVIIGTMAASVLSVLVVAVVGPDRIWTAFTRGQSTSDVASGSGRTEVWGFVIKYCITHPQGMGYVAGFRDLFKKHFALGSTLKVENIGNCHNAFIEVLAAAGWLALFLYLAMLLKIVLLGWRFAKKKYLIYGAIDKTSAHGIRCSLVLLVFCMVYGMDTAEFSIPLRATFYFQYVIIAMILGASVKPLIGLRARLIPVTH
jgi:O-antigen ligase